MQQVLSQMEELQQLNPVIQGNGSFKEFPYGMIQKQKAERFAEYQILRCNNESLIPLCIDVDPSVSGNRNKIWFKMHISNQILVGHLRDFIKKFLQLTRDQIILVTGQDIIIKYDFPINEIYKERKDNDGWLYLTIRYDLK